eukprot:COSAG01_NODE_13244_length_1613_cov_2.514531_1_plen_99_part_00
MCTSPLTGAPIEGPLVPNEAIRSQITSYCKVRLVAAELVYGHACSPTMVFRSNTIYHHLSRTDEDGCLMNKDAWRKNLTVYCVGAIAHIESYRLCAGV